MCVQVETMDPSTPIDLLNATEDYSLCNSTPMNRAHALGVSVGEARRAFARVQRQLNGITTEAEVHMAGYSLFACTMPVQIINGRLPTSSTNFDYNGD